MDTHQGREVNTEEVTILGTLLVMGQVMVQDPVTHQEDMDQLKEDMDQLKEDMDQLREDMDQIKEDTEVINQEDMDPQGLEETSVGNQCLV